MLLTDILAKDIEHCDGAVREDEKLRDMEAEFYRLGEGIDKDVFLKMESMFVGYCARLTRIAYLQGLKDFQELHLILKGDTADILTQQIG
jgi:hypothetical protein